MTRLFSHPEPIEVIADSAGTPLSLRYGDRWRTVTLICNQWRVTTSWWESAAYAHREYTKLVADDELLCTVYRDLTNDAWYLDRIYD